MNNYDKSIDNIKESRQVMIKKVTDSIKTDSISLTSKTNELINQTQNDEKKQKELLKVQELITSLIEDIINAKDETEINKIRKRLNYYINKIKKELKKREISEKDIEDYQEKVCSVRSNISKYIRFLKRNKNIEEIEQLNNRFEELLEDDSKKLKQMISLEKRYNKKYTNTEETKKSSKELSITSNISEIFKQEIDKIVAGNELISNIFEEPSKEQPKKVKEEIIEEPKKEEKPSFVIDFDEIIKRSNNSHRLDKSYDEYDNVIDYLNDKISLYKIKYGMLDLQEYDKSIIKNSIIFLKNFLKYIRNKKTIEIMKRDNRFFYSGSDLTGYIEYSKQRNSIKNALKGIFSKTNIFSSKGEKPDEKNRCIKWILDTYGEDAIINNKLRKIRTN